MLKEENQGREPAIQVIACDNRVRASLWRTLELERTNSRGNT